METRKLLFLTQLAETGNVSASADEAGLPRHQVYDWRRQDEAFARRWEDALMVAVDKLAFEARRRALDGVEEVRYFQGEPVGSIRKYSDQLLMFLLRAYDPDTFLAIRRQNIEQITSTQDIRDQLQAKIDLFLAADKAE
jgi:transposase-like protein